MKWVVTAERGDRLALGDFQWIRMDKHVDKHVDAVDAVEKSLDAVDAVENSFVVAVCERKTIKDLVGRSAQSAHSKQLRRLHAVTRPSGGPWWLDLNPNSICTPNPGCGDPSHILRSSVALLFPTGM